MPLHRAWRLGAVLLGLLLLGGCNTIQSALNPAGLNAREVAGLWWPMFWVLTGAYFIVLTALFLVLFAPREWRHRFGGMRMVVAGGVILPAVTITAFVVYSFMIDWPGASADQNRFTIDVTGHQFWWEVRYTGPDIPEPIISANEVRLPVGEPVLVRLTTADVIHSFWIPSLSGKTDMIPGQDNHIELLAERPGILRGQCYEFCGAQHANMAFMVVAMPPDEFDDWLRREARPARAPDQPLLARGQEAFIRAGCGSCHRIRGTAANGNIGPDLTHLGSRLSIAAGMLDNTVGNIGGWIVAPQNIKPGNLMPSFNGFDGETLRALAHYLDSLE